MFLRNLFWRSVLTTVQRAFRNSRANPILKTRPAEDVFRSILKHEVPETPAESIIRTFVMDAKNRMGQRLNSVPDPAWRRRRREFVRATITGLRALITGVKALVVGCLVGSFYFVWRKIVPRGDKNGVQKTPPDELVLKPMNRYMLDHRNLANSVPRGDNNGVQVTPPHEIIPKPTDRNGYIILRFWLLLAGNLVWCTVPNFLVTDIIFIAFNVIIYIAVTRHSERNELKEVDDAEDLSNK